MTAVAPTSAEPAAEAERADAGTSPAPAPAVPAAEVDESHAKPSPSAVPFDLPDPLVQAATRELVRILAPLLGLDAARVQVTDGPPAARPGSASLGPAPQRPVVVHELAHVAQHANRARGAAADTTGAEAEAAGLEAAARAGAPLWTPRTALPEGRVARQADASGVAPKDVPTLKAQLDALVKTTRAAELQRIKDAGSGVFTTWAEAVEGLLQVLQTLDFVTARAVVHALEVKDRIGLVHLNDGLHQRYPGAAAAALAGLSPDEVGGLAAAEPNSLRDALHGLAADRLTPTQLRAVLETLRAVPEEILVKLERGDRRDAFRALLGTPAPSGTDLDELQAAVDRETVASNAANDELARSTLPRLQAVIAAADAASARNGLDILTPFAEAAIPAPPAPPPESIIPGVPDTPAPDTAPVPAPVKTGTNAPPTPGERLQAIVEAADAVGLIDRILDGLPESERYDGSRRAAVLRLVLAARAPALTLPRIEPLLSYGVFDWAVRDYEARWANLLVRSLPLPVQDAWRASDNGKWFQRLGDNIPDELIRSGEYTGVGSEYLVGGEALSDVDAKAAGERYDGMLKLWKEHSDGKTAMWITHLLLGIDPERAQPMLGADKDANIRVGATRRLDTQGTLDDIYRKYPSWYLLGEQGRNEIGELTAMRDPVRVELGAAKFLETGFTDWWISDREGWIGFQLLRSLPAATQQRFQAADPARWSAMLASLTAEMRQSLAVGAATGRGPFPGRDQLRKRLGDPRLWDAAHVLELRALMDLARATDDAEWVFEQSRIRNAWSIPGLEQLVSALQLYDPRPLVNRTSFKGEDLKLRPGFFELTKFIDELAGIRWILMGLGAWLIMDWVSIGGKSVKVKDFDLTWAQWANGGDLGGAKLMEQPDEKKTKPSMAGPNNTAVVPSPNANKLSMEADLGTGAVRLRLPELAVQSLNIVRAGSSYRTGPLILKNLRVQGDFSDRHYREPVGVELDADSVDVDDFVLADPSLPSGAWALAHLMTRPIHVKAGAKGDEDLSAHPPREGSIPIPIFGPLLEALSNVVALKGAIPFDYTFVDFALIGPTAGMSKVASIPLGIAANKLVPTPAPFDLLWGLVTDGTVRPPRSAADRAKDAIAMLKSFEVSFDELTISGLSIGAGQQVSTLTLKDVDIGVGLSRPAYLRLLVKSLTRVRDGMAEGPDKEAIQKRITDAQTELDGTKDKPGLIAAEEELEKLERKDRWIAGSLSEDERKRMIELQQLVRMDTGIVADIGGIEAGPLTGTVVAAGVKVGAIHLDGRLPLNTAGYLTDEDLAERFRLGGPQAPTVGDLATAGDVRLTIASASIVQGADGEPALRVLADKVPTEAELIDRLAKMPEGAAPAVRERVQDAREVAHDLELLQAKSPKSLADQDSITSKTNRLRELLGIEVGTLTLGPITGGLDKETGALTATVHGVDARDIKGDGFAVKRVSGDVTLGVQGLGGMDIDYRDVTGDAAKKALAAQFGLDVTAEGIATETSTVGEVSISGLHADVTLLADGYKISQLWATRIGIKDVKYGDGGTKLTATGAVIEGLGMDAELHMVTSPDGKTSKLGRTAISRLDINRLAADTIVYDAAKTEDGETLHVELISGALVGIRSKDLTIVEDSDGATQMAGTGTVAGVDQLQYKVVMGALNSATKKTDVTTVSGTLQGGVKAMPPPVPGAEGPVPVIDVTYASTKDGSTYRLGLKDLELLGTHYTTADGTVVIRHATASGTVTGSDSELTADLNVKDVDVSHIDWKSGTARIKSDGGAVKLNTVDMKVRMADPNPEATDPRERSGGLWVEDFDINGLDASSLTYTDLPIDVHLSETGKPKPGALTAKRIRAQHFFLPYVFDPKLGRVLGSPTAGHLGAVGLHAEFGGAVAKGISASGILEATSLAVDFYEGDTMVLRAKGVTGDVGITQLDDPEAFDPVARNALNMTLSNLDTGVVTVTPDAIEIGGVGKPGLHFDMLHLEQLSVNQTTGDHPFSLLTMEGGGIDIINVDLVCRIERWKKGEKHDEDQPFKRAVISRFEIARIEAESIWLSLPSDGVILSIPKADEYVGTGELPPRAMIRHIVLAGDEPGHSFEWVPGKAGSKKGTVALDEISIPKIHADVAGKFNGDLDLHTDAASIGFLANGDTIVDVANPRAKLLDPATLDDPNRTIKFEELGAEKVHVDALKDKPAKVTVTNAHLDKMVFEQPGIHIDTRKITLPGDTVVTPTEGTIPEVRIDDAHIHVDFTKLPPGESGPPGVLPIDRDSIEALIDHINGEVSLKVFLKVTGIPALDPRDISIPASIEIKEGKVNYATIQSSLQNQIGAKVADEEDSTSYVVEAATARPEFWISGEYLVFGLHITDVGNPMAAPGMMMSNSTTPVLYEIVRWNLGTDEIKTAKEQNLVRVAQFVHEALGPPKPDTGEASSVDAKSIELQDIKAKLSVTSDKAIPLTLKTAGASGTITMSPNAIVALQMGQGPTGPDISDPVGFIPAAEGHRPKARGALPKLPGGPGLRPISMEQVNFDKVDLTITNAAGKEKQVTTGDIQIKDMKEGTLDMKALYPSEPIAFDAKITSAVAHNIHWDLAPKPKTVPKPEPK